MPATLDYPHIVKPAAAPAHLEKHPRTRVAMIVMDHVGRCWSPEEIVRQYPYLTLSEVHAALGYYFDHRAEIDDEIASEVAELDRTAAQPPSALRLRLLAFRRGEVA